MGHMAAMCGDNVETLHFECTCHRNTLKVPTAHVYTHMVIYSVLAICCKLASGSWLRIEQQGERESIQSSVPSFILSQRGEATVGNMNYEMIRGCKMEINPSDYTAQYLTIRFLCQWFFIVVVWRTASLIISHVWSTAGESIVMIEFFWTWLRKQLHFASHFQNFFSAPLSFPHSPMAENSTTSNRVCLLFPSPGVPALQKAQEITRGKT